MPISQELLEMLVCPADRGTLELVGNGLRCLTCRRIYPIEDDIPIMLVDEARIDPSAG